MDLWAYGLARLDLPSGSRVAIALPSCPELAFAMLGAWRAGFDAVLVSPYLGAMDLARHLESAQPGCVILDDDADASSEGAVRAFAKDEILRGSSSGAFTPTVSGEAVIGFTSGTSGPPKAVRHSASTIERTVASFNSYLELTPEDEFLCVLPSYLVAACIPSVIYGLWLGAPLAMLPRFSEDGYAQLLAEHSVGYFMAVPAVYRGLLDSPEFDGEAAGRVRWNLCGAAPLDAATAAAWEEATGTRLSPCSGSTEAGGYVSIDWTRDAPAGAAGKPLGHLDLKIVDADDNELPPGETGEIALERSAIFSGYVGRPDDTSGLFRTGDLGHLGPDGHLFYTDRTTSVINRGGFKIFPAEVEAAIALLPGVELSAVIAVPDERLGEVPLAFIETQRSLTIDELKEHLKEQIASYKIPAHVRCVPPGTLPRSSYGKVSRAELHRLLDESPS